MNFVKKNFTKLSVIVMILTTAVLFIQQGTFANTPVTVTDNFTDETKIAAQSNLTVNTTDGQVTLSASTTWACSDALLDARDGQTYGTVLIGDQCWMQQNLNIGTMVLGSTTQNTSCAAIEKYCYANNESNCGLYGGLYQWAQAMCGGATAGATGICPAGWHIPTHDEFTTLERATCTSESCATDFPYDIVTTGYRGTNEGTTMKNASGDFRGLLAGIRTSSATFTNLGPVGYFWSSVESGANAWYRQLDSSQVGVRRAASAKTYGFSVRCLKD